MKLVRLSAAYLLTLVHLTAHAKWSDKTYIGVDHVSNRSCSIQIIAVNPSFFGDSLEVKVSVDSESMTYRLFNHPIIKGSNYGSHYVLPADYKNPEGKKIPHVADIHWAQLTTKNPQANRISFIFEHLGTELDGLRINHGAGARIHCVADLSASP